MNHTKIHIASEIKTNMYNFAKERGYAQSIAILERGDEDELCVVDVKEAEVLGRLMQAHVFDVLLKYPHYDEEEFGYNPQHDAVNHDVVAGDAQSFVLTLSGAFPDHKWGET